MGKVLNKCLLNWTVTLIRPFLSSEVQLNRFNAVVLSAFILHPASVTTLQEEGKFNLYIYLINASPASIINNNDNQCQLKFYYTQVFFLHMDYLSLTLDPKSATHFTSLYLIQMTYLKCSLPTSFITQVRIKNSELKNNEYSFKVDKV